VADASAELVFCIEPLSANPKEETQMKTLVSMIIALGLIAGASAPVLAASTPKDKASCDKAHMKWDDASKKCSK
jgi:hypothetical protein